MSQNSLSIEPFCSPTTWKMSDIFHDLAWKISNFFRNYKLQRPSARWHVVRDNVFRYSRSLAATCSQTGRKWPQVAASGRWSSDRPNLPSDRKWPQRASGRKWPQVAAEGKWPQVAASVKWPQVAASGRFRQVAASGRLFQFQIPHLMQPLWNFRHVRQLGSATFWWIRVVWSLCPLALLG